MAGPQDAQLIDAITSKLMGPAPGAAPQGQMPPGAPPQGAMPAPQGAAPMPQPPAAPAKETPQGQAAQTGAPQTEADRMSEDAILYEIQFGENDKRKLTPQQIKATFERYSALNYKNAAYKPVMDLVEQIMSENPGMNPAQLRQQMEAIYRAQASNPTMGDTRGQQGSMPQPQQGQSNMDIDAAMKKWEEENAASLPPGYREFMTGQQGQAQTMQQMQAQMQQMARMLQMVLGQAQGVAQASRDGMMQGQDMQVQAVRQTIANNIDRVQQALQLPDSAAQDFMTFAAERGYTLEDFVDPQLTIKVMTDFRNNMSSPEMERMRAIAARRQAYTGSLGPAPAAGGPGAQPGGQPNGAGTTFDAFANKVMSQKGMG